MVGLIVVVLSDVMFVARVANMLPGTYNMANICEGEGAARRTKPRLSSKIQSPKSTWIYHFNMKKRVFVVDLR
jgi:hypothetical protein